jgi:hypothetical protein
MICIPKYHKNGAGLQEILRFFIGNFKSVMFVLLTEIIVICLVETGSHGMLYMPSSMKIGTGVKEILRFSPRNLKSCNVSIADGRDL